MVDEGAVLEIQEAVICNDLDRLRAAIERADAGLRSLDIDLLNHTIQTASITATRLDHAEALQLLVDTGRPSISGKHHRFRKL